MFPSQPARAASEDGPSLHIDLVSVPPQAPGLERQPTGDDLREALRLGQLEVHYEPVVDLRRREVVGAEALVRWRHLDAVLLMPEQLVPLAESTGLVAELDAWVLHTACRDGARWRAQGLPLEIAVNVSIRSMAAPGFVQVVRGALDASGLDPRHLLVELTESAVVDDKAVATGALAELKALGVSLGIDDFGTGYSSLVHLKRYPVGALKVDRSFVAGLGHNADDDAIVSSIVKLAGAVGALCIAEGVETRLQHRQLVNMGCDRAQGALFSPPVPAPQLAAAVDVAEASVAVDLTEAPSPEPHGSPAPVPQDVMEQMLTMYESGASFATIAAALHQMGSLHPRGTRWHRTSVARCIAEALRGDRAQRS